MRNFQKLAKFTCLIVADIIEVLDPLACGEKGNDKYVKGTL